MLPPPEQLDGANVLLWTPDLRVTRPTARTTHRVGGDLLGAAVALAICQYDGDSQYYLFYCDDEWNVRTDTCHPIWKRSTAVGGCWRPPAPTTSRAPPRCVGMSRIELPSPAVAGRRRAAAAGGR